MASKPVPPPDSGEPPSWANDLLAKAEEKNWDKEGKLRGQKEKNDLLWLKAYGIVIIALMIVFALLFLGSIIAWAWHYVMPEYWGWLSPEQLSKIQSVIFSGSLGGIVSLIAQKQLSK